LALGIGDWINVSDGDWDTREDYGTLPAASLYWAGWGWNGSLGVPLKSSFKRLGHKTRYSLGDGEISAGKRFGAWSPRVSLKFPLYDWSVENAGDNELYIGSGTWDLALGLGGRLPTGRLPKRLTVQFDIEGSTVLASGLADYGSYHGLGVVQATYALDHRWKAGINGLFLFDHSIWIPDFWDQEGETKFSIVPGAVVGVRLFQSTYVDLKAGWGLYEYKKLIRPKYAPLSQDSYNFGVSVYQAFK
ncbi:MAG: hypothetical protein ABIW76_15260, partial [Fibrobacteria bacterium]